MSDLSTPAAAPATPRREFLGQLATVAAALAATACVSGGIGVGAASPTQETPPLPPMPALPPLTFNDEWASQITSRYRAVFDSPDIDDGTGLFNALTYVKDFKDVMKAKDADVTAVLVVRHRAVPMAMDDSIWERYKLGEYAKVKDEATNKWATRNPFLTAAPGDVEDAEYTLTALHQHGGMILACALATHGMASILAKRTNQKSSVVFDEFRRHLVVGAQLAPSGIFAVMRAQEAGCHYMRST
ncbi:MAG TPA: hypothetical protein VIJ16_03055 [Gemmatimonadaceae bacterium]